jgi:hypothetical protein
MKRTLRSLSRPDHRVHSGGVPFDPDHFRREYPGKAFPDLRFCSDRERWEAKRRLADRFDRRAGDLWELFDRAKPLDGVGEPGLPANLLFLRVQGGIEDIPREAPVFLDWYLGEQASVPYGQLSEYFNALWQPDVDDLAVFDDSFEWVLYFTRDGGARLLNADVTGPEQEQE